MLKTNKVDYSLLDKEEILKSIRNIKNKFKDKTNLPNIYILHGEFTNEELNKINNDPKVKSFVSFTKGEGFGRPLLEQAIAGKPVITTNWSGHIDFIRPEYNVLIGGELKPIHKSASNKFLLEQAQWFNINTDIASKAMNDVYKNYKKYIDKSRKQTKFLGDNFSQSEMTKSLKDYVDQQITKIGVIFNLDKHDESGSHWTSMFVDLEEGIIFYFDSNGTSIPNEINKLVSRITEQGKKLPTPILFKYQDNYPLEHQKGNNECGMYSLYFIITMLTNKSGRRTFKNMKQKIEYFTKERIPDKHVFKHRKKYFNS